MKVVKESGGITHRIAMCSECAWRSESASTALKDAKKHVAKTNHAVSVETANFVKYVKSA